MKLKTLIAMVLLSAMALSLADQAQARNNFV